MKSKFIRNCENLARSTDLDYDFDVLQHHVNNGL